MWQHIIVAVDGNSRGGVRMVDRVLDFVRVGCDGGNASHCLWWLSLLVVKRVGWAY